MNLKPNWNWVRWGALLVAIALALILGTRARAATIVVTWAHPTQYTDGSDLPLTSIKETLVEYGQCAAQTGNTWGTKAGETRVTAPATTVQITTNFFGNICARGYTVTQLGSVSDASNVGAVVKAEPKPKPPVFVTTLADVYEVKQHPIEGTSLGRMVGTAPLGTPCGDEPVVYDWRWGEFHEVSVDTVTFTKAPKSAIVVARCAMTS